MRQVENTFWNPTELYTEGWSYGPPRGILFHYTAGCGDPQQVGQTLLSRRASAHFCIDTDPKENITHQYVDLDNRAWHAYDASHYYYGIEHVALPGTCNLSIPQLNESARISAEIIKYVKEKWGVSIPVVRAPGCEFSPGFKQHRDGLGCDWNPNGHVDGLVQTWTWPQYLSQVQTLLEDDDMALFASLSEFRKEVRKAIGGFDSEGTPHLDSKEFRTGIEFVVGLNLRLDNQPMPELVDVVKRNGWIFADELLKEAADNDNFPTVGTITGQITLQNP